MFIPGDKAKTGLTEFFLESLIKDFRVFISESG